jgi:hypothetical protein
MFGAEETNNLFLIITVYGGVVFAAFSLAMILWTYRDMRARSRDPFAQLLVAIMVAVLNFPGLLIYVFLRPRETLSEAYERSLEEEALLQEIEEKPTCPGCGQRTHSNWQVCPQCHTRLKKSCPACGQSLELSWTICPYCATPQTSYEDPAVITSYVQPMAVPRPTAPRNRRRSQATPSSDPNARTSGSLEFIDGEEL